MHDADGTGGVVACNFPALLEARRRVDLLELAGVRLAESLGEGSFNLSLIHISEPTRLALI
eukprot:3532160-Alexandrium_andersonii.AAC.1